MNILMTEHQGWHTQGGENPVDLPMNPDKIICDIIEKNILDFDEKKTFVKLWFSKLYHDSNNNLDYVQSVVDSITDHGKRKDLVFICGHIISNMLKFGENKVLTYHGSIYNNHTVTIPMPAFNFCKNQKKISDRTIKASFAGSFDTHWSRRHMWYSMRNKDNCLVEDTGAWHYYKEKNLQKPSHNKFRELLGNSIMTISPRGTGPCTIRLWEAIESMSIPIIISDEYKYPNLVDLNLLDMSFSVSECEAQNMSKIIDNYTQEDISKKYNTIKEYTGISFEDRIIKTLKKVLNND
jgi:hypothetical protein